MKYHIQHKFNQVFDKKQPYQFFKENYLLQI